MYIYLYVYEHFNHNYKYMSVCMYAMSNRQNETTKFEREIAQAEYEIMKALEDSIINLKKGGMTRTSFYNMINHQNKEMLKAGLGTPKIALVNLQNKMRVWDCVGLE